MLLQQLLDKWKAATTIPYRPTEEELAALEWFITISELSEYDRIWLVQIAGALGMKLENLVELTNIGQIVLRES